MRKHLTSRRAVGLSVAAMLVTGSATALASTTTLFSSAPALPALPSVVPSWASTAKVVGATPADQTVYVLLALKQQDPAGLAAYGQAASTPGNPLYRHWLTKEEFEQRYAPAASVATTVTDALKTLGVTNVMTDKLGLSVLAAIPASLASTVFGVKFQQLEHAGQSTRVAMNQPTLPASLLPFVTDVSGLTQERVHTDHVIAGAASAAQASAAANPAALPGEGPTPLLPVGSAPAAYNNPNPGSTYYGSLPASDKPTSPILSGDSSTTKPYIVKGYKPAQVRGAYGVDKVSETGKGVTAGVVLFYDGPDVASDLSTFSTAFGLAAPNYTDLSPQNQAIDVTVGSAPVLDPLDAAAEQTLDVEAIHQMAPDASIVYSGAVAPEDEPIYVAEDTAIAGGAQVINNSYGGTGDTDASDAAAFQTLVTGPAMSLGVGLDYSSGDSADHVASDSDREADFPATSDEVTAVGGTGIEIGAKNDYEGEYYWGTYSSPTLAANATSWGPFASQAGGAGGGGGLSTAFAEPSWQKGVVPAEETVNADTASSYAANDSETADDPTYGVQGSPGRVIPDVSMIADSTTGLLVGETQMPDVGADGTTASATPTYSYYRIGGTSVSSPIFTGMMALVDQAIGKSAGFVNPTIYPFEAKHDGSFRDPQIGRTATGSRLGSTMAQVDTTCTGTVGTTQSCAGTGPGVVPVVAEVRPDYTDPANNGIATVSDPLTLGTKTGGVATPGNPVVYHLRGQGVLGTLEDLPGYDDSTGLGSPDAPQFIADFLGTPVTTSPTATPTASRSATPTPSPTKSGTVSCAVRGSSLKVYGPGTAKLNQHGQAGYSFKLFVNLGACKTPTSVGRQFYVYVDGHRVATLRTGKSGVISYLVRLKPGKHTIAAAFPGDRDLKKSASAKFSAHVV